MEMSWCGKKLSDHEVWELNNCKLMIDILLTDKDRRVHSSK